MWVLQTKKLKPGDDESGEEFFEDELFHWNSAELVDDVITAQQEAHRQRLCRSQSTDSDEVSLAGSLSSIDSGDVTSDDITSVKSDGDDDESLDGERRKSKTYDGMMDALESVRKQSKDKEKIKV